MSLTTYAHLLWIREQKHSLSPAKRYTRGYVVSTLKSINKPRATGYEDDYSGTVLLRIIRRNIIKKSQYSDSSSNF